MRQYRRRRLLERLEDAIERASWIAMHLVTIVLSIGVSALLVMVLIFAVQKVFP